MSGLEDEEQAMVVRAEALLVEIKQHIDSRLYLKAADSATTLTKKLIHAFSYVLKEESQTDDSEA